MGVKPQPEEILALETISPPQDVADLNVLKSGT